MKKLMVNVIVLCFMVNVFSFTSLATDSLYTDKATMLNQLGLFSGSDKGYELERAPKRVEAAVMLIRLLGLEKKVLSETYTHPFKDVPAWANQYVGYMYENGLTKGIGSTTFGSNDLVDSKSYATFVLRALAYDDSKGDFKWATALDTAVLKKILSSDEKNTLSKQVFKRGDMVNFSANALSVPINKSTIKLIDKLVTEGAVKSEVAMSTGLIQKTAMDDLLQYPEIKSGVVISRIETSYLTPQGEKNTLHKIWVDHKSYPTITNVGMISALTLENSNIINYSLKKFTSDITKSPYSLLYDGIYSSSMAAANKIVYIFYDKDANIVGRIIADGSANNNYDFKRMHILIVSQENKIAEYGKDFTFIIKKDGANYKSGDQIEVGNASLSLNVNPGTGLSENFSSFSYNYMYIGNGNYTIEVKVLNPNMVLRNADFVE